MSKKHFVKLTVNVVVDAEDDVTLDYIRENIAVNVVNDDDGKFDISNWKLESVTSNFPYPVVCEDGEVR